MTARLRTVDLLIVLAGVIATGVHISTFHPFYSDDAMISLRYAQRLLEGHGLTWSDGPPVEGYSNLLWILGCALLGRAGMDLIVATRVLGALGIAAVFAALLYYRATSRSESPVPFAVGVAVFALAGPVAAWAWAGLETPFVAAFLAWGFVLLIRSPLSARTCAASGVCFGLLSLTRPDGPMFAMVAAAWLAFVPGLGERRRKLMSFLIGPALLIGAQLAFRLAYYGELVPNVWYIKVSPSIEHFVSGAKYVRRGLVGLMPASVLVLAGLVLVIRRDATRRVSAVLLLGAIVAWLGYIAFIGGDIFPGRRHMVPFVVLMSIGFVIVFEWVVSRRDWQKGWISVTNIAIALALFVAAQRLDSSYQKARNELWVWNAEVVGRVLGDAFGEKRPLLAVTAAGGIPYWSELPCIDMLGLNDRVIARAESHGMGSNWIGHERADARYVMSRRPDFIHFGAAAGGEPVFAYKEQMAGIPVFWSEYTLCRIGGFRPYPFITRIYVDRTSPRVGIINTPERIDVPLYFIEGGTAMWDDHARRFFGMLPPKYVIGVRRLRIDAGTWEIELPDAVEAQLLETQGGTVLGAPLRGSAVFHLDVPTTVDVAIRSDRNVELYGLAFVKR